MSHFTVLVIGENPKKQLEPFYEGLDVPRYVSKTREQMIAEGRKEIEDYKNSTYAEYLSNPAVYLEGCSESPNHAIYISEEFPRKLNWTDEEVYQDQVGWYDAENIGPNGEVYSDYNPHAKWDWYSLGGRWTGFFKLKLGATGKTGRPGIMTDEARPGYADQLLKKDVDFEFMRNESANNAAQQYDFAISVFGDTPIHKTYDEIKAENPLTDIARKIYWDQPRMRVWAEKKKSIKDWPLGFFDSADEFLITREEYLENARNRSFIPFAILKDGIWYEKGEMGWFGVVTDAKNQDEWNKEAAKMIMELPDDTLLSLYDCHI